MAVVYCNAMSSLFLKLDHRPICDILYCDIILLYIDFLTILFSFNSFILLVKLVRLSLVFIKGNLTWLDYTWLLSKDVSSKLLSVFAANYSTDFDLKTSERDLRAVRIICCSEVVYLSVLFDSVCDSLAL